MAEVCMKKKFVIIALLCVISILSCFSGCVDTSGLPAITMAPQAQNDDSSKASSKTGSKKEQNATEPSTSVKEQKPAVASSWFDDAVFVGDSVTLKLSYYCDEDPENTLSDAKFFCAGSLGYTNALWDLDQEDAVHPYYQGQNYQSKDCASVTGASKVFIMLGMNDLALYGIDDTIQSAKTLIGDILTQSPGVTIYVQSVTPIIAGKEDEDSNNINSTASSNSFAARTAIITSTFMTSWQATTATFRLNTAAILTHRVSISPTRRANCGSNI